MTKYICKCGRVVAKNTTADNTGNRDTAGCEGCPYLLPWGPFEYVAGKGFAVNVQGYECRMSKDLEYATRFGGSITDKCTCYIASLDFDFLTRVSDWIKETYPDKELVGSFSVSSTRAVEYSSNGRYRMGISCAQNKKGIAAKASLLHQFFDDSGARLDMTPEEEKAHILAAIEAGKARAKKKEGRAVIYKDPATGWLYRVSPKPEGEKATYCIQYLDPKSSAIWKPDRKAAQAHPRVELVQRRLAYLAREKGWELLDEKKGSAACTCADCNRQDCTCPGGHKAMGRKYCDGEKNCAQNGCSHDTRREDAAADAAVKEQVDTSPADDSTTPDGCPYLQPLENSTRKKYAFQCSICGDKFVNQEICNKTFLGCGWYLDRQEKAGQMDDDEPDRVSCMCRTCGKESCCANGCTRECPANADESCLTESCPEYVERTETVCGGETICAPSVDTAAMSGESVVAVQLPKAETSTDCSEMKTGTVSSSPSAEDALNENEPSGIAQVAPISAAPEFDYSGLDAGTAERLQNLARRAMEAKRRYILDMMEIVVEAHRELCDTVVQPLDNGRFSTKENTFAAWCASIGVGRSTAYNLLQVQALMDGSTPEEQEVLAEAPAKLLYAAAKPSAPAELVQAVKDGDITTHKQYQEAMAQLKAEREAREESDRRHQAELESNSAMLAEEQRRRQEANEARIAAEKDALRYKEMKDAALETVKQQREKTHAAERRASAAEAEIARQKRIGMEMQEEVESRDERIRELQQSQAVVAGTADPEEIERRAQEIAKAQIAENDAKWAEITENQGRKLRELLANSGASQAVKTAAASVQTILDGLFQALSLEEDDVAGQAALEDLEDLLFDWSDSIHNMLHPEDTLGYPPDDEEGDTDDET